MREQSGIYFQRHVKEYISCTQNSSTVNLRKGHVASVPESLALHGSPAVEPLSILKTIRLDFLDARAMQMRLGRKYLVSFRSFRGSFIIITILGEVKNALSVCPTHFPIKGHTFTETFSYQLLIILFYFEECSWGYYINITRIVCVSICLLPTSLHLVLNAS